VDQEGNVFFTDQPNNRIHRWDWRTGEITTFLEETGRANGMTMDANGLLIAASDMHGEIWSIDPRSGEHTVILDNYEGKRLNGPNDIWIAANGGMYITDPLVPRTWWDADDPRRTTSQVGGGYVYYLTPDRKTLTRVAGMEKDQSDLRGNQRIQPNGVVGSLDGRTLYVGYIFPREIWAYDIQPDGSLSNPRKFADSHSDGMTIDAEGNIYLTTREAGVTAFSPAGERILNLPTGRFWTGNVSFAGPERKTLFVTAADAVFTLDMRQGGVR
jgi:gluconolactonase